MLAPTKPADEEERLEALNQLELINGKSEERFDRITRVLAALFNVPVAMVNLIAQDTQVSKSCFGVEPGLEMDRSVSFCGHTILSDKPLIISNALEDERFRDNPNVADGLKIRAYAGVPLHAYNGTKPGALCLIDIKPREFTEDEINLLIDLSSWAEIELNAHQLREALDEVNKSREEVQNQLQETQRLNQLMIGRELKMVEMKKKLAELGVTD